MVSFKTSFITERDLNTKLTLIFNKIGQLDKAQEGIQELYELLLEHPECDIKVNLFLASAGTFFQNYLRKALDEITTRKMQACGMSPKDFSSSNDRKSDFNHKKMPHKFPSTSNRCSHSSNSSNNTKVFNIENHKDVPILPETTSPSRTFMDKVNRETFDQTRSRLHGIFQYEKYKTGQKRSSLQEIHRFQTDSDRLEFAKSILQSKPRSRRATWMASSSTTLLSPPPERFSSSSFR
ncbi:hypothetical protein RhiirA5_500423 [Rhizophagus irregularis]|uniref:Cytoskeleton-associated protein 5-like n=3 Tax=Rhizophagus irregularis TaxID=588596 RepID=A0A2I1EN16_9GLOM|nr:hypothetical protein GLOIN_2v1476830 [Rhizophagus irregularis DAOM 181602=DAOM 197198]EXX51902.1 hypothetical protein RirG_257770 [Rhizophagus irregularis DAOM 197198w]PKC07809.1 hypothetical protein RhiirA5_500423 [Rhizophagus irregularis]PKC74853.1 hypothetical protein RhiirA1_162681 [Rhizophagus irregularis]PKY23482.1 hypothetical protein RhiirB3_411868 [Rhizophagus irregularis]POG73494.1 hypothetical protein GLOIN_2v1476830 [Rhizophagus irregularis DAOM 181602=DAOM 197198]|eukprot:XP_025180360.1 hypothetical protein GLOIN_2v1476830 [Rhizophagus irregularis DAOM 181602=DAOM 197198]